MIPSRFSKILLLACTLSLFAPPAFAQASDLNAGDTAWMLTATALVLFMTLPGLALFYGGLVRAQSVLSVLMHCLSICCLVSVLWLVFVYGLAFGDGGELNRWIGLGKVFLAGVGFDTAKGHIPESVFFMFQMTFAIITPALIVGAYVERVKFTAVVVFSALWLVFVYAPVAHWVWGGGWLADIGALDFAGGMVVHTTAGVSAILIAAMIRTRTGFPHHVKPPHSPGMTLTGAAMLWVGWFGFNAGSALTAGGSAGMAMLVTHISAATASIVWMGIEWLKHGRPTLIGLATGSIAGLATITPASGYVGPAGGFLIGVIAGGACYCATAFVKNRLLIDDSLDVMAVHGVGGMTGTLLTAIFAASALGGAGLPEGRGIGGQLLIQALGVAATALWSGIVTILLLKIIERWIGFTVTKEVEIEGLDIRTHGEKAYEF
jgi:Amt family ammonium transporter